MPIRNYVAADNLPVVAWWHERLPALHRVAEVGGEIKAHLQVAEVGAGDPRRAGECHVVLHVEGDAWDTELPQVLLDEAVAFANGRQARRLLGSYLSTEPEKERLFLVSGFEPFERFHPLTLALSGFNPSTHQAAIDRVEAQGIRTFTYAEEADTEENRHRLYEVEMAARAVQPFRQVADFVPPPFEIWEGEFEAVRQDTVFLAADGDRWVGMVNGLNWPFTAVHPDYHGRGIATALKVQSQTVAKREGLEAVETENHEDNVAMRAVIHRLGFLPGPVETRCVLVLQSRQRT